ncbi:MAG: tRNA epoxyqueuosine(34) reductase QueG, partial [Dehalococcoidia bacterium]
MHASGRLKRFAHELGFAACGIASAKAQPETAFVFHERIDLGMYDGLPWFTHDRATRAADPGRSLAGAASVITLAAPYKTEYPPTEPLTGLRGRVARYAWGRDYHRVLERRLKQFVQFVEAEYGGRSRGLVDYGPLAERAYAARAGIGWFGKNTNLLLPGFGSWALLAELITTVAFEPDAPLAKTCGGCTRCISACPTGAISGEYVVDNRLCISYQTIENRGWIPRELRPLLGDWVFGCDLCQDVCPVGRGGEPIALPEFAPATLDDALPGLTALLRLNDAQFLDRFKGRAIMRAKRAGLARNACVALGNL